jgi:hypothetical protein
MKNTQKHTQGPWKSNYPLITAQGNMALTVAVVLSREDNEARADSAAKTKTEAMANAQLIAAAPDLLQVTKDFLLLAALHDWEGAAIDFAKATLSKAEGVK